MNTMPFEQPRPGAGAVPAYYPPHSIATEQALLGAILVNADAYPITADIVRPEYFFHGVHRIIWETMTRIVEAAEPLTMITLHNALGPVAPTMETERGITLAAYLAHLMAEATTVINAPHYARGIREYWALRRIDSIGRKASEGEGYIASQQLAETLEELDGVRAALVDRERHTALIGRVAEELVYDIAATLAGDTEPVPLSRITKLDDSMGGFLPSTLTTLAGRPGMGKTIVASCFADNVAQQNFGVVYHSTEVSRRQIGARIIARRLEGWHIDLPFSAILKMRGLSERDLDHIKQVRSDLETLPLRIEDAGGVTIGDIQATTERRMNAFVRNGLKPGLVIIDHAHQLKAHRFRENRVGEMTDITQGALALAKNIGCHVLLCAQLNRQVESRDDKRPNMSDLRASGSFEEDSDNIILLYRAAAYLKASSAYRLAQPDELARFEAVKNDIELIIAKHRAGESNETVLAYVDLAHNVIANRGGSLEAQEGSQEATLP